MVVLDQFYQISEANPKRISILWKVAHIIIFIGCVLSGVTAAFAFGQILDDFNFNCVLNAEVVFDNETFITQKIHHFGNVTVRAIDLTQTIWGTTTSCNFAQFTPLFISLSALIFCAFFVVIGRGGGGYPSDLLSSPWSIVYPALIFTVLAFIPYVISVLQLRNGLDAFCKQFIPEFGKKDHCSPKIDVYGTQFHENRQRRSFVDFCVNKKIMSIGAEIGIWAWVAQFVLLLARIFIVTDFDLHLVTIISKEEEYVENVVEFPDEDENEVSEV